MIKVSVIYPNTESARFDHEYYRTVHMPMIRARLEEACSRYTIDKGISGVEPGSAPAYIAMCHIYSDTVEGFREGMRRQGAAILADIRNFTDLTPIVQISEERSS